MRSPSGVDDAITDQQAGAGFMDVRNESIFNAGARRRSRDFYGGGLIGQGGQIERVQTMVIIRRPVFGHGDDEDGAMRSFRQIDRGSGGDSNLRSDLTAAPVVGRDLAVRKHGNLLEKSARIGVESIHAVMFRGNVEY